VPPTTDSERLMAKIVDTIPETAGADEQVRRRYETPAPRRFFEARGPLVLDAHGRGEHELALRFLGQWPDAVRAEVQRYVTGLRDRPNQADDESIGQVQTSMPPLRWRLRHPVKWLVTGYRISG
jgi:hypothetical protein